MASRNAVRLFIGNLPWTVGTQELRQYFREFGRIANATVIFDKNSGISKGYGFVTFYGSDAFERINNQKTHVLDGWTLAIQPSTSGPKRMAEADIEINLKDRFASAAKFLETVAMQLDSSQLLEFYSYYKQATQGKCCTERPSWFNITARQKWDAWNRLGNLGQEEAMKKYISLLSHLFEDWEETVDESSPTAGWVAVSSMAKEEPDLEESEKKLSDWVREGDKAKVKQHAKNNTIDQLDDEGLGPIHWAADRGNLDMLRFLVVELKADIELQDQDGQTALHYAASCGHSAIVKLLVELGANTGVRDADGTTPRDVASEPDIVTLLS